MRNRRLILGFSIGVSVLLHGLLIMYSDRLALLAMASVESRPWSAFRVDLVDYFPEPAAASDASKTDASGEHAPPATLEELIERETAPLPLAEPAFVARIELPQLVNRLDSEPIEREYALEPLEATQADVDAKILEITQAEARQDIEVPRRLVRPSASRVIAENEFPTFNIDTAGKELLAFAPLGGTSFGSEPVGVLDGRADALTQSMLASVKETEPLEPLDVEPRLRELPEELDLARAPLSEELKRENPYEFFDDMVTIEVESYIPPHEEQGYFRLRISPKKGGNLRILPKDVTFVLDASSSIVQRKLDVTARGVAEAIRSLRSEDQFNIVVFRDTPNFFRPGRVPATEANKAAALDYLKGLKAYGQTDVFSAIQPVVNSSPRPGYPGITLVVTDGCPTKGLRDARMIINNVTAENQLRNPVYAFSGGRTVNRYLLDLLAYRNKGESFVTPEIEGIGGDLPTFFGQLSDPLLVNLRADLTSIDESSVYPKELPDFFMGRAVTVYGRFTPDRDKELAMRLIGSAGDRRKEVVFRADLDKARTGDKEIARLWAFRKIYHIIGDMCEEGETPERLAELRKLGRQYNIRTSYDE